MFDKRIKQAIVNEYLVGGSSYRKIGKKYGVNRWTVNRWVLDYQSSVENELLEAKAATLQAMKEDNSTVPSSPSLAAQIKELQKQLEQEQLHNRLLTAMIDIAEEELKIPIRKKYGTRQSKK
jgi:transposase-like protein